MLTAVRGRQRTATAYSNRGAASPPPGTARQKRALAAAMRRPPAPRHGLLPGRGGLLGASRLNRLAVRRSDQQRGRGRCAQAAGLGRGRGAGLHGGALAVIGQALAQVLVEQHGLARDHHQVQAGAGVIVAVGAGHGGLARQLVVAALPVHGQDLVAQHVAGDIQAVAQLALPLLAARGHRRGGAGRGGRARGGLLGRRLLLGGGLLGRLLRHHGGGGGQAEGADAGGKDKMFHFVSAFRILKSIYGDVPPAGGRRWDHCRRYSLRFGLGGVVLWALVT
ncbi:hypothetical protein CT19431_40656 [Cupriavidus taiwanensis]|nr:hypothetical protein CT19431_40656 [Cupriavidus taiwanensis]